MVKMDSNKRISDFEKIQGDDGQKKEDPSISKTDWKISELDVNLNDVDPYEIRNDSDSLSSRIRINTSEFHTYRDFGSKKGRMWTRLEKGLSAIPFISFFSNIGTLIAKAFVSRMKDEKVYDSHFYTHIKEKSIPGCVTCMIPIFGNLYPLLTLKHYINNSFLRECRSLSTSKNPDKKLKRIKNLLERGANPHRSAFYDGEDKKYKSLLEFSVEKLSGLPEEMYDKQKKLVKLLLQYHAYPNNHLLKTALETYDIDLIKLLINKRADHETETENEEEKFPALIYAISSPKDNEKRGKLIDALLDIDYVNVLDVHEKLNSAHWAIKSEDAETLKKILNKIEDKAELFDLLRYAGEEEGGIMDESSDLNLSATLKLFDTVLDHLKKKNYITDNNDYLPKINEYKEYCREAGKFRYKFKNAKEETGEKQLFRNMSDEAQKNAYKTIEKIRNQESEETSENQETTLPKPSAPPENF